MAPETGPSSAPEPLVRRVLRDGEKTPIDETRTIDHDEEEDAFAELTHAQKEQVRRNLKHLKVSVEMRARLNHLNNRLGLSVTDVLVGGGQNLAEGAGEKTGTAAKGVGELWTKAWTPGAPERGTAIAKVAAILVPLGFGVVAAGTWLFAKGKATGRGIMALLGLGGAGAAAYYFGTGEAEAKRKKEEEAKAEKEVVKDGEGAVVLTSTLNPRTPLFGKPLKLEGDTRSFTIDKGSSGLSVKVGSQNFDAFVDGASGEKKIAGISQVLPGPGGGLAVVIEESGATVHGEIDKAEVTKLLAAAGAPGGGDRTAEVTFKFPLAKMTHSVASKTTIANAIRKKIKEMSGTEPPPGDPVIWQAKIKLKPGTAVGRETIGDATRDIATLEESPGALSWDTTLSREAKMARKPGPADLTAAPAPGTAPLLLDREQSATQSVSLGAGSTFDLRMQRAEVESGTPKTELLLDKGDSVFRLRATERGLSSALGQALGTLVEKVERTATGLTLVTKHEIKIKDDPATSATVEGRLDLTPAQLARMTKSPPENLDDAEILLRVDSAPEAKRGDLQKKLETVLKLKKKGDSFAMPIRLQARKIDGIAPPNAVPAALRDKPPLGITAEKIDATAPRKPLKPGGPPVAMETPGVRPLLGSDEPMRQELSVPWIGVLKLKYGLTMQHQEVAGAVRKELTVDTGGKKYRLSAADAREGGGKFDTLGGRVSGANLKDGKLELTTTHALGTPPLQLKATTEIPQAQMIEILSKATEDPAPLHEIRCIFNPDTQFAPGSPENVRARAALDEAKLDRVGKSYVLPLNLRLDAIAL